MKPILRVALTQMNSSEKWEENLAQFFELVNGIKLSDVDFITVPENAFFIRSSDQTPLPKWTLSSEIFQQLSGWCRENSCRLHIGSVPLQINGAVFNSTIWIEKDGTVSAPYQKVHLFDVEVEGHPPVRESDSFRHGEGPAVLQVEGWKVGLTICYDVRFSELFTHYHYKEVDLILVPSAFLVPTGKAHWEVLLRARAIETQSYILAAAECGVHGSKRRTYGHSLAVDPWGLVLRDLGDGPAVSVIELDASRLKSVRSQIPVLSHRRLKV